jgi:uncharacterized protein YcgL (UPF0745 family)
MKWNADRIGEGFVKTVFKLYRNKDKNNKYIYIHDNDCFLTVPQAGNKLETNPNFFRFDVYF